MFASTSFPPLDVSIKLAISVGIGMLVGLEREWAQKDLDTRIFTITAVIGTMSVLVSPATAAIAFGGVLALIVLAAVKNLHERKPIETTTSAALITVFILGLLVGQGHHYTPIAVAIIMTMLLTMKPALTHFAGGLKVTEVRAAVILGLLAFVIYPVLPDQTIDPWQLINPREAWLTVVAIAALGFVNYVLLKLYGSRGLYYSAILGGMVNSTAAIAELSSFLAAARANAMALAIKIDFLTIVAMFVRNLLILVIFARAAASFALLPLGLMAAAALVCIRAQKQPPEERVGEVKLSSPLSLPKVLKFGLIFLVIEIIGNLGQRYLGHYGFLLVSVIGGLVSSASTTGAAATLVMHGKITPLSAGLATCLTSMASALSNLPLLHQQVRNWDVTRRLAILSGGVVALGLVAIAISEKLWRD